MNLNPLYELKERLESSVIAGVSLLSEDFRLARAVEQMEPLAKASPIFQKIYQSAQGLLSEEGARYPWICERRVDHSGSDSSGGRLRTFCDYRKQYML